MNIIDFKIIFYFLLFNHHFFYSLFKSLNEIYVKIMQNFSIFESKVEVYDPKSDTWTFVAAMCAHGGGVGVGVIPIS